VWSIPEQVDRGNLAKLGLIRSDADYLRIEQKGITASSGSVMKMAQEVFPYQRADGKEKSMFLAEHRRCVPEIISYCNDLAYDGRLKPKRPSIEDYPWPHMGYFHVKGKSQSMGGSRKNEREVLAVIEWLTQNKEQLEKYYQTDLDKIVGIITPFAAQKQLLFEHINSHGIGISKIGTVHAFQGAEQPVIIFSSVYSANDRVFYFFDLSPNMLNVAVSRAQDSFIVIGDMDIFDPATDRPSGLMARYLFAAENNELLNVTLPSRATQEERIQVDRISSLQKHRDALARAFERAKERLVIISPYLRWRAVNADDIGTKVAAACARGVEVLIYVDDGFNENLKMAEAAKAARLLSENGAEVRVCHNIHSKIICIDNDVFIEGSFNWLSAERLLKDYSRYETSTIHLGESAAPFIEETLEDIQQRVI